MSDIHSNVPSCLEAQISDGRFHNDDGISYLHMRRKASVAVFDLVCTKKMSAIDQRDITEKIVG